MLIHYFSLNRGGRGGGYKELDEQELEETKRRRREAEDVKYDFPEELFFCCCLFVAVRMISQFFCISHLTYTS